MSQNIAHIVNQPWSF